MTTVKGKVNGKSKVNGKVTVGRPLATIEVSDIEGGHKITVTDPNGIQELDVMDGKDGKDGLDGEDGYTPVKGKDYFDGKDGEDGYTPVKGKDYFDGKNGEPGYTPVKDKDYFDGKDGQDGISPTISAEDIDGGHRVTITDKNGQSSFDVMDGKDGEGGTGGTGGGAAIIDVTELPTEGASENVFYRLLTTRFIFNKNFDSRYVCVPVDGFPENPEPITKTLNDLYAYYNIQDGNAYGYVDEFVSAAGGGVPTGWYTLTQLGPAFDIAWDETPIKHIDDDPEDDTFRILLTYELYVYKDEWMNVPFGYELPPEFDIQWDGAIGDRFALDMSALGYVDTYQVKVSDEVFTVEQLIGATITQTTNGYWTILEYEDFDTTTFAGAISIDGGGAVIIYSSDETNAALGLPSGYLTNGVYFAYMGNGGEPVYTDRLIGPTKIVKIDKKFLPEVEADLSSLHPVARTGNYNDLSNKPTIYTDVVRYVSQSLSSSQKSTVRYNIDVYSKSEVKSEIATAIGTAIGSGY